MIPQKHVTAAIAEMLERIKLFKRSDKTSKNIPKINGTNHKRMPLILYNFTTHMCPNQISITVINAIRIPVKYIFYFISI